MPRIVLDTNIFISAFLVPESSIGSLRKSLTHQLCVYTSIDLVIEIESVLLRPKFARFTQPHLVNRYIDTLIGSLNFVSPLPNFPPTCRDPKDDLVLATALAAQADIILTGDADLLALHPFQGIQILTPAQFLEL